jgi:hypothetical protein
VRNGMRPVVQPGVPNGNAGEDVDGTTYRDRREG